MLDREARKKWLSDMAHLFSDAADNFGKTSLESEHLDGWIEDWIRDAAFFHRQFLARIELYDFPFIKDAKDDAELRKNAQIAEMLLKRVSAIHHDADGEALQTIEAHRAELEYILEMTEREE